MPPPNPTIQTSPKGISSILASNLKLQVADEMALLYKNTARLTSMFMQFSKRPVKGVTFGHFEDQPLPYAVTYNGAAETTPGTTIAMSSFTNGSAIIKDAQMFNPDNGEVMHVEAATVGGNVTLNRRVNSSGDAVGMKQGATLVILAPAREEGETSARDARTTQEVFKTFYLQNCDWTKVITYQAGQTEQYTGQLRMNEHTKMQIEAMIQLELLMLLGVGSSNINGTSFSQPAATGINKIATDGGNVRSYSALTYDEIESFARTMFPYHAEGWLCVTGLRANQSINGFTRGHLQITQDESTYGQKVSRLDTSFGEVDILAHPLLATGIMQDWLLFIPKPIDKHVYLRYLSGPLGTDDLHMVLNTQANDSQRIQDELRGILGLEAYEAYKWGKMAKAA